MGRRIQPAPRYVSASVALARPVSDAIVFWALATHKPVTLDLIVHMIHTMRRLKLIKAEPSPAAVWTLVSRDAQEHAAIVMALSHPPAVPTAPELDTPMGDPSWDPLDLDTFFRTVPPAPTV